MADLDDFFAKKDRKKNKGKKFTTTDEIAKKLEETGKKIEKTKKEKPPPPPQIPGQEGEEQIIENHEDDEWKEFEEEKKDYTGLKIGNLQITEGQADGDNGEGDDEGVMEENEAGEMVPRKRVQAGPWKMVNTEPKAETKPEPERQQKRPEQSSNNLSSYVPPHLRNQPKEQSHTSSHRLKNRAAPDINNKDYFPTLSASKPSAEGAGAWGRRRREDGSGGNFEEVRNSKSHSGRGYADVANKSSMGPSSGPKLSLGNKYGALSSDQS